MILGVLMKRNKGYTKYKRKIVLRKELNYNLYVELHTDDSKRMI